MCYVFVISQPVELKLDSELEDISRSHNLQEKKYIYSIKCLYVCRVFHEVKHRGHTFSY